MIIIFMSKMNVFHFNNVLYAYSIVASILASKGMHVIYGLFERKKNRGVIDSEVCSLLCDNFLL